MSEGESKWSDFRRKLAMWRLKLRDRQLFRMIRLHDPAHWEARENEKARQFAREERRYRMSARREAHSRQLRIVAELAWLSIPLLLVGGAIVVAAETLEQLILPEIHAGLNSVAPKLGEFWTEHLVWTPNIGDGFSPLAQVAASVSGVVLGLYFTGISVLVSSRYKDAPAEIRDLLIRWPPGIIFAKLLGVTVVVASAYLLLISVGYQPSVLGAVIIGGLAGVSILSFLALGLSLFYFFNPARLTQPLIQRVRRAVEGVTPGNRWWSDSSFQAGFQGDAEDAATVYQHLLNFPPAERELTVETVDDICADIQHLLTYYASQKWAIPSSSKWFRGRPLHREWLTASHYEVQPAIQAGVSLPPRDIPDMRWLEDRLDQVLAQACSQLMAWGRHPEASRVVSRAEAVISSRVTYWDLEPAGKLIESLCGAVRTNLPDQPLALSGAELEDRTSLETASPEEGVCLLPIQFIISAQRSLERVSQRFSRIERDLFENPNQLRVEEIDWPRRAFDELDQLDNCIMNEKEVEGERLTPSWVSDEVGARQVREWIRELSAKALGLIDTVYIDALRQSNEDSSALLIAYRISRGFEAIGKAEHLSHQVIALDERLAELDQQRVYEDPLESISLHDDLEVLREELVGQMSNRSMELAQIPPRDYVYDFFGQAYSIIADELIDALVAEDADRFESLFPQFFVGVRIAMERSGTGAEMGAASPVWLEPLLDLCEISGLALLMMDAVELEAWNAVRSEWRAFVDQAGDKAGLARNYVNVILKSEYSGRFGPRALVRTSWKQRIEGHLREGGLLGERMFSSHFSEEPDERPPILRETANGFIRKSGRLLFAAVFLSRWLPEDFDLTYGGFDRLVDEIGGLYCPGEETLADGKESHEADESSPSGEEDP